MTFSPRLARFVRRTLLTFAVLATVVLVAVLIENWRGDRAWAAYAAKARAEGAQLDSFPAPSDLPAARNFMKTPVLDRWLWARGDRVGRDAFVRSLNVPFVSWSRMWLEGRRYEPSLITQDESSDSRTTDPADESVLADALEELRRAARERPDSELQRPEPITWERPFDAPFPSFAVARSLVNALGIDACLALQEGLSDRALADVLASMRLGRGFLQTPDCFLVEAMIGTVIAGSSLHAVWEGIDRAAWDSGQLRQIQLELSMLDPAAALERALEVERTGVVAVFDHVPVGDLWFSGGENFGEGGRWNWRRLVKMPRGWVQQNKVAASEVASLAIDAIGARGTGEFLIRRDSMGEGERQFGPRSTPYTFLAHTAAPAYEKVGANAIEKASWVRLAEVACALERHQLAHGSYPAALAQLVPDLLGSVPRDLVDGQPLRYRIEEDGSFTLYAVGSDGIDDGGTPIASNQNRVSGAGDWCWPRAVPAAP